jgi:hypothetical protein
VLREREFPAEYLACRARIASGPPTSASAGRRATFR